MLWSMLTNRTLLWKYFDAESCSLYNSCCNPLVCRTANVVEDCDPILTRAKWIPSYDEWQARLNLPEPVELPYYTTHPNEMADVLLPWGPGNDESVRGVDVLHKDTAVVVFPQMRYKTTWMTNETVVRMLLHSQWSRALNRELFSLGADYLFGMLQHHSLQLTDPIQVSAIPQDAYRLYQRPHEYHTIALHSRHHFDSQNGCDIVQEQNCLNQILETLRQQTPRGQSQKSCAVTLMSDRTCTIDLLTTWLEEELGCRVFVAVHEDAAYDYKFEHGPFAGAGFYEDLALASMARSAFIGTDRSSSDLVLEQIAFHRTMESLHTATLSGRRTDLQSLLQESSTIPSCKVDHSQPPSPTTTFSTYPRLWVANLNANGTSTKSFELRTPNMTGPGLGLHETMTITAKVSCDDPHLKLKVTPRKVQGPVGTVFELNETLHMNGCVNGSCYVFFKDVYGASLGAPHFVSAACDRPAKRCYEQALSSCSCPYDLECAETIALQYCPSLRKGMLSSVFKRYEEYCASHPSKRGPLGTVPR